MTKHPDPDVADLLKPYYLAVYEMGSALENPHIAIRNDAEVVLRLMNSPGRVVVNRLSAHILLP